VRQAAEEALKLADADTLRAALQGHDPASSPRAFRMLAELGDDSALAAMIAVLDEPPGPRAAADVAVQLSVLTDRDGSRRSRARAQEALAAFRSTEAAIPLFVHEFMHGPPSMVTDAGQHLAEFGDKSLEPLLQAMGDGDILARYRAVAPMTVDEAQGLVLELTARRIQQLTQSVSW
jgi:HEAT repeat protein